MNTRQFLRYGSYLAFILGFLVWIPNLLGQPKSYWLLDFIVNPLGILFGYFGKTRLGIVLNSIMIFGFVLFMGIGYLINFLFGGKP